MQDSLQVGCIERVRDLNREVEQRIHRQWPSTDLAFQSPSLKQFHGDERCSFVLANLVYRADVGMIQG